MRFCLPTVETLQHTCDSFKLNLHQRSEQDDERMETGRQGWKELWERKREGAVGRIWNNFIWCSTFINAMSPYKANTKAKIAKLNSNSVFLLAVFGISEAK